MGGLPSRMNLLDITIVPRSTANTIIDDDFDEPIAKIVDGTTLNLRGQIKNERDDRLKLSRTGDTGDSTGRLVFKKQYLDDLVVTLAKGDRITSVGGVTFDAEIIEIRPKAPLNGVFLFYEVHFQERMDTHAGGS